jgi:hypothetical protein
MSFNVSRSSDLVVADAMWLEVEPVEAKLIKRLITVHNAEPGDHCGLVRGRVPSKDGFELEVE